MSGEDAHTCVVISTGIWCKNERGKVCVLSKERRVYYQSKCVYYQSKCVCIIKVKVCVLSKENSVWGAWGCIYLCFNSFRYLEPEKRKGKVCVLYTITIISVSSVGGWGGGGGVISMYFTVDEV